MQAIGVKVVAVWPRCDPGPSGLEAIRRGISLSELNSARPHAALQAPIRFGYASIVTVGRNRGQPAINGESERAASAKSEDVDCRKVKTPMRVDRATHSRQIAASHSGIDSRGEAVSLERSTRNKYIIQQLQRQTMRSKRLIGIGLALLFGCAPAGPEFECTFKNMTDDYQVTETELEGINLSRSPVLIEVTRNGRTFMFRRDRIIACASIQ